MFETLAHTEDPAGSLLPHLSTLVIEAGYSRAHDVVPGDEDDDELPIISAGVFQTFLESRTQCPEEFRLRKVVGYETCDEDFDEMQVHFIPCLNRFRSGGLEVNFRLVTDDAPRISSGNLWLDRDPTLELWPEAKIVDYSTSGWEGDN